MTARIVFRVPARLGAAALAAALFFSFGHARAQSDRTPIVTTPAQIDATEGVSFAFVATASDPDGEPIDGMSAHPLPQGATFTTSDAKNSSRFEWTPEYTQAGTYNIQITAVSACRAVTISDVTHTICMTGGASTRIDVANADGPPIVTVPFGIVGEEGSALSFLVAAGDPDSPVTSLTAAPLPLGATFTSQSDHAEGLFEWAPEYGQAGIYTVTFTAENALSSSSDVTITIRAGPDRSPVVASPSAVSGTEGSLTSFAASASDPDGDAIESFTASPLPQGATFTVNASKTAGIFEWTPSRGQGGFYTVRLSAQSACRPIGVSGEVACVAGNATMTITIEENDLAAHAFTTNANRVLRLGSGKATWCVQLEPVDGSYDNGAVDLTSLLLSAGGAQIPAIAGKVSVGDDKNGNGAQELTVCFPKDALRAALSALVPRGNTVVNLVLEGDLVTGGHFRADFAVTVNSLGGSLASSVSPNPMNPDAVLTFTMPRAGWARVSLFDLQGRLMRRVLDQGSLSAGIHDVRVDVLREDGARLPSGVYFYRVETAVGAALGRLVIAK